jgi:hypothetical protein
MLTLTQQVPVFCQDKKDWQHLLAQDVKHFAQRIVGLKLQNADGLCLAQKGGERTAIIDEVGVVHFHRVCSFPEKLNRRTKKECSFNNAPMSVLKAIHCFSLSPSSSSRRTVPDSTEESKEQKVSFEVSFAIALSDE